VSAAAGPRAVTGTAARRRAELGARLRAVARPLLVYWVFLVLMFGAFAMVAILDSPKADSVLAVAFFAGITAAGVLTGQLLALLRVRDWVIFLLWAGMWTAGMAFGVFAATVTGPIGTLVIAFVLLFPLFTLGGAWSLRAGRTLFGAWVPLMYASACAIIVAENQGKVATWKAGSKWAVWNGFTLAVLAVAILLFLAYLVSRESHRLSLWRHGPRALLMGSVQESGAVRPRLSCLGWVLVLFLALGLTAGTAFLAPYLWRTGPGDHDGGDEQTQQDQGQDPQPRDGKGKGKSKGKGKNQGPSQLEKDWQEAAGDNMQEVRQELQPQVSQALDLLSTVLIALALFLLALLAFWRPVRRIVLARHYERPFLDLAPTERIRNGWRLVEIAMGDAGVEPRPNEPAASLLKRAQPTLTRLSAGRVEVHGLAEAAEIRDRVEYGLGVNPADVAHMERTARWAYHTVWDRMGEWLRVKMLYRGI